MGDPRQVKEQVMSKMMLTTYAMVAELEAKATASCCMQIGPLHPTTLQRKDRNLNIADLPASFSRYR